MNGDAEALFDEIVDDQPGRFDHVGGALRRFCDLMARADEIELKLRQVPPNSPQQDALLTEHSAIIAESVHWAEILHLGPTQEHDAIPPMS